MKLGDKKKDRSDLIWSVVYNFSSPQSKMKSGGAEQRNEDFGILEKAWFSNLLKYKLR